MSHSCDIKSMCQYNAHEDRNGPGSLEFVGDSICLERMVQKERTNQKHPLRVFDMTSLTLSIFYTYTYIVLDFNKMKTPSCAIIQPFCQ